MSRFESDDEGWRQAVEKLGEGGRVAFEKIAGERYRVAMAKAPFVVEHVQLTVEGSSSKVIVFAHHKDVMDTISQGLTQAGIKHVIISGSTPVQKRAEAVDKFQT